ILPPPVRRILGDLSDRERVLIGLDLLYDELNEESLGFDDDAEAGDQADDEAEAGSLKAGVPRAAGAESGGPPS
ncbi:MAG: circadian clock protein KaiB, partial [Cyanobium sp.]